MTCSSDFLRFFTEMTVEHVLTEESDHAALLIMALESPENNVQRERRGFRYEEMWTRHDQYDSIVHDAWNEASWEGSRISTVLESLLTRHMQSWSRNGLWIDLTPTSKAKGTTQRCKREATTSGSSLEAQDLEAQLYEIYGKEELMYM